MEEGKFLVRGDKNKKVDKFQKNGYNNFKKGG